MCICKFFDLDSARWRHQMKTFSALLALCAGNSPVTSEFPSQRPVTRNFDVFFYLHLNKRLSKQRWGCDLRRHRAQYDVTVLGVWNTSQELCTYFALCCVLFCFGIGPFCQYPSRKIDWYGGQWSDSPGARPTKHISIEFEIRWKFRTL